MCCCVSFCQIFDDQAHSLRPGFFLPAGFPASVADDYLPYQLWAVPCHITGWMASSLATSSLLQVLCGQLNLACRAGDVRSSLQCRCLCSSLLCY